ncbi:Conserved_hypothetical protein [Hexamita inflata]|uniref:Transmembrane protein n=1 Tax=Hexamita inflata TaxID=28002 RepID=A0AA86NGJ6_9EUKA|nr:Conserved hypothetical protein [Hexamita inflata]
MAGDDARFQNVTIRGKCVRFYANSPRNIEYPIQSGIINSIQSLGTTNLNLSVYTQYYGPKICVDEFTYMPAFYLTTEDPALLELCNNLSTIQSNFTEHVNNGTWEYLGVDKNVNTPENIKAIAYTQQMIDKIKTTCQSAYFLPKYLNNLANISSIFVVLYFGTLIIYTIIRQYLTKTKNNNEHFGIISKQLEQKKQIELVNAIIIAIVSLCVLIYVQSYLAQFLVILIIFIISLVAFGYQHYHKIGSDDNENYIGQTKQQIRKNILVFAVQFIISITIDLFDILQTITNSLQMLQYMKFQYYLNRIQNIKWLMNPANQILMAAQYLGQGIYPYILLGISLINQELMRSEWFKLIIKTSDDPLDTSTFLFKKLLKLFNYYQNFTYNVFFAYTDTQLKVSMFKDANTNEITEVMIKIFLAGTLYSISKFNLLLEYYQQLLFNNQIK